MTSTGYIRGPSGGGTAAAAAVASVAGAAGPGGARGPRPPRTAIAMPPPSRRTPRIVAPIAMPRSQETFTPAEASTATPAEPPGFMATILQSPPSTSQVRVCSPGPDA